MEIPADRARWRLTVDYRLAKTVLVGIEYNPVVGEIGPRATWEALLEDEDQPALHFGVSSDRIGTPKGYEAVFATASKTIPETNATTARAPPSTRLMAGDDLRLALFPLPRSRDTPGRTRDLPRSGRHNGTASGLCRRPHRGLRALFHPP